MKRWIVPALLALALSAGCHGQLPPNPTTYTCTGVTTFTPLNSASPATGLSYVDSNPGPGVYCYIAQSVNSGTSPEGVSVPSNVSGPTVVNATLPNVTASWTAPTTGVTPTGYVLSRAPAIAVNINAPTLGSTTSHAENVLPDPLNDTTRSVIALWTPAPPSLQAIASK